MKLSIIVPFHKGVHFLDDCFESIKDQGIVDFETVLVLDHVKEDISDVLNKYQEDIHIKTVELTDNLSRERNYGSERRREQFDEFSGVAAARNAGLENADGEYVYFLDSDDYIINNTLLLLLKEAEEQHADFTYGKKASTWYGRMAFLASYQKDNENEDSEEQEPEEQLSSQEQDMESEEDAAEPIKLTRRQKRILKVKEAIESEGFNLDETTLMQIAEGYYTLFTSKKGLRTVSVVGILFRKNFLNEYKIRFCEDFIFFSDISFLILALKNVSICNRVEEALYVKRKHNDPIHFPALSQSKTEDKFDEYIAAYRLTREIIDKNSVLRRYLDEKCITYFVNSYAPRLRRSEKDIWRKERFQAMQSIMKEMDAERIHSLKRYKKKVIKALIKGDVKKTTRIVNMHLGIKKFKKIKKNKRVFAYYLYNKFFLKKPTKENWVIFESFYGKGYSDSPKYIYEYLAKNYPGKYRFIWVINNKKTKIPFNPTKVKRFSIRYCYYIARCKYYVLNTRQPEFMKKRDKTIFLETWHGTPLKRLVFDQDEVMTANPLYKATFYYHSRVWDYLISANHFSTEAFKSAFLYDNEILEYGYPRNDIMYYENKDEIAAVIKNKLGLPKGKKTILYAPTWRDDEYYGRGQYKFDLKLDLRYLKSVLGDEYVVLLRTHYFIADSLDVSGIEDFAVNVSKYDDISELYLISDILITDYSSVFFDYANLKRPVLFYTYDLDKYRDMLRGFYLDIETEVPGPLLFTTEEVADAIKNIDVISAEYKSKYEEFYERFCGLEDGHASENVVKRVFH